MREISVIVPFYNTERYIRECITGLLTQNYPEEAYEIITKGLTKNALGSPGPAL